MAPERAYLELVRDGVDGFVVTGPGDVLNVLDTLIGNDERTAGVFAAVGARGREFGTDTLLDRWVTAFQEASGPRYGPVQTALRRSLVLGRFSRWAARAVLRRLVAALVPSRA